MLCLFSALQQTVLFTQSRFASLRVAPKFIWHVTFVYQSLNAFIHGNANTLQTCLKCPYMALRWIYRKHYLPIWQYKNPYIVKPAQRSHLESKCKTTHLNAMGALLAIYEHFKERLNEPLRPHAHKTLLNTCSEAVRHFFPTAPELIQCCPMCPCTQSRF